MASERARGPSRHRSRPHVRVGHRQDREPRPHQEDADRLVRRLRDLVRAADGDARHRRPPAVHGNRDLGQQHPGRLGLRHHQLRLVDRDRPCRHADLGDPAAAEAAVAHVHQPLRRGDDALRRGLRRDVPDPAHGPVLDRVLLADAVPEHDGPLAQLQEPADLGRVRGVDLRHGVGPLLVRRADPRPRDAARPRSEPAGQGGLRLLRGRLARLGATLGQLRDRIPDPGGALDAARAVRAHRRELRLRGRHRARLARHDLPALLRGGRHLRRLRDGADARDPAPEGLRARGLHHAAARREHGQGDARDRR